MKCSETGCPHEATHAPKLCVPAMGWPQEEDRAITMVLSVQLCRKHCEEFQPSQMLDVPNEKGATLRKDLVPAIARMTGSKIPPDCDRAWIVPLRIDSEAYRAFQRAQRG